MTNALRHPGIALFALLISLASCADTESTESPVAPCPEVPPEETSRHEFTLVDASRPTPSNGTTDDRDSRSLRVVVWDEPTLPGPLPILLMAHGFDGSPDKYESFASAVAAEGVVVVAPEFPLTHYGVPGGPQPGMIDLENMPGDLSFVLDALTEAASEPCDPLFQRLDMERITAMGHSLGGAVLTRATRHSCCVEPRIASTVFLAAATAVNEIFFPDDDLEAAGPPTLVVHGREDDVVDLEASEALYGAITPPKAFLVLEGTGHSDAIEGDDPATAESRAWMLRAVLAFMRGTLEDEGGALSSELNALSNEGHTVINELDAP